MRAAKAITRIPVPDLCCLWAETPTAPMNIALIATFDGGPLTGPDGEVRLAAIRSFVAAHLDRARMLRRALLPTRPGQGRMAWIDAQHFDVEDHVLLAAPGRSFTSDEDFMGWCAHRSVIPLDHTRPLWRMDVVPGLPGGRAAVLVVLHHVVADGLRGVAMIAALLDPAPDAMLPGVASGAEDGATCWWRPEPPPAAMELVTDNVRDLADAAAAAHAAGGQPRASPARAADPADRADRAALINLGLVQQLTGDYPAAVASHQRALELNRDLGDLHGQGYALNSLGVIQQETGDYRAAAASQQQALALFGSLGDLLGQAYALNDLGVVQQETVDYPAAATSHQQALALFRECGNRLGQAEALNRLGELSSRTSATGQAREHHTQALAIARSLGAAPEEARALEGLGQTHLHDGNPGQAATQLRQSLTIYQRIGAPAERRVQDIIQNHKLTSTTPESQPAVPDR